MQVAKAAPAAVTAAAAVRRSAKLIETTPIGRSDRICVAVQMSLLWTAARLAPGADAQTRRSGVAAVTRKPSFFFFSSLFPVSFFLVFQSPVF
jgi:hypothetical protein